MDKKKRCTNCETCRNFVYDEDMDTDVCMVMLDEDEYIKYLESSFENCPYYQLYDEYKMVRSQN